MTERKDAGNWGAINKNFSYNPWSINLMNEEIAEILNSDGLIGISLDIRILGFQAAIGLSSQDQSEYLSIEDFKTFFPNVSVSGLASEKWESLQIAESWLVPTKEDRHPLCLCFNILHVVSIGLLTTAKDPWSHICIGSDFDGLIDPLKICKDSSQMSNLENDLIRWLPIAEKSYLQQNGGPDLLERNTAGRVDLEKLKNVVRAVMYGNGRAFVERWLRGG